MNDEQTDECGESRNHGTLFAGTTREIVED